MNFRNLPRLAVALLMIQVPSGSCRAQDATAKAHDKNPPAESAEGGRGLAPKGDIREDFGYAGFVFYFLPEPAADPAETFATLAKAAFPETTAKEMGADDRWDPEEPLVGYFTEKAPLENFPTPDEAQMKFLARGVSEEDAETVAKTGRAFIVRFAYPREAVRESLRASNGLAVSFAEKTKALIWDSTTRELFSADSFRARRIDPWPAGDEIPDLRPQITIHAYKKDDGDFCRAVTLGMRKFALPDVALEDFAWSDNRSAGNLINLVCQYLAENGGVEDPGDATISISEIQHQGFRESFESQLIGEGTGAARVEILLGEWEEGDAANRLLEVGFGKFPGKNIQLRQARLFDALFGSEDAITEVDHDENILAASARAKAMLPVLRRSVERGLPPGEILMLKAPFPRDDGGNEWMWVEVIRWKSKEEIRGILRNDPFHIKGMHAGMEVDIAADDVFDYLLRKPDGTTEGNETGKLIEKKAKAAEKRGERS